MQTYSCFDPTISSHFSKLYILYQERFSHFKKNLSWNMIKNVCNAFKKKQWGKTKFRFWIKQIISTTRAIAWNISNLCCCWYWIPQHPLIKARIIWFLGLRNSFVFKIVRYFASLYNYLILIPSSYISLFTNFSPESIKTFFNSSWGLCF